MNRISSNTTMVNELAPFKKIIVTFPKPIRELVSPSDIRMCLKPVINPWCSIFLIGFTETSVELLLFLSRHRSFVPLIQESGMIDDFLNQIDNLKFDEKKYQRKALDWKEAMELLDQAREYVSSASYLKGLLEMLSYRNYAPLGYGEDEPPYKFESLLMETIDDFQDSKLIEIRMNGNDSEVLERIIVACVSRYNGRFGYDSTAHYRLKTDSTTSLETISEGLCEEMLGYCQQHVLVLDYQLPVATDFRTLFESALLFPFLKRALENGRVIVINRNPFPLISDQFPVVTFQFYSGLAQGGS